jgi:hypothetical protein
VPAVYAVTAGRAYCAAAAAVNEELSTLAIVAVLTVTPAPVMENVPPLKVVGLFHRSVAPVERSTETLFVGNVPSADRSIVLPAPLATMLSVLAVPSVIELSLRRSRKPPPVSASR